MTDEEFSDLIERAHQIRSLQEHPGWEFLTDYAKAFTGPRQRALLGGVHDDLLRYKSEAGYVQGAAMVLGAADELEKRIKTHRDRQHVQHEPIEDDGA